MLVGTECGRLEQSNRWNSTVTVVGVQAFIVMEKNHKYMITIMKSSQSSCVEEQKLLGHVIKM